MIRDFFLKTIYLALTERGPQVKRLLFLSQSFASMQVLLIQKVAVFDEEHPSVATF